MKRAVHICGYFGPDPGADKPLRSARACLKRMAYCQEQGQRNVGTSINMTWMHWYDVEPVILAINAALAGTAGE